MKENKWCENNMTKNLEIDGEKIALIISFLSLIFTLVALSIILSEGKI